MATKTSFVRRFLPRDVVIASFARTPIGSLLGSLSSLPATKLGAIAMAEAIRRAGLEPSETQSVIMGQVLSAGCGQSPTRQAALEAAISTGIPCTVDVFGVNKVCSSGLKSIALAAQSIALGHEDIVVAGGMESMSQAPYLLRHARHTALKYGHKEVTDSVLHDGLWDPYNDISMGACAEKTARDYSISRAEQDEYAVQSYKRAADAWKGGVFDAEIAPVRISTGAGGGRKLKSPEASHVTVLRDEEHEKINLDKIASLKPAFDRENGTITAGNASSLNDGAAAVVLMSAEKAQQLDVSPIARVLSFADAAVLPIDFSVAPTQAVRKALSLAQLSSVDYHEINEAFAAVALANMRLLSLDPERVNIFGGAVALGHPIGMSGSRILMTLCSALRSRDATTGCASICNGGGSATAMVIERI